MLRERIPATFALTGSQALQGVLLSQAPSPLSVILCSSPLRLDDKHRFLYFSMNFKGFAPEKQLSR